MVNNRTRDIETAMKTNLRGLLSSAGRAAERGDKTFGAMHAYVLMELGDHIRGLLRGEHTIEEFASFYCIDMNDKEPWADPGPNESAAK
jgi:hypothetical protein